MKPMRIGLHAFGGADWVGGAELTKNLIVALDAYCVQANLRTEIYVLGNQNTIKACTAGIETSENVKWINQSEYRSSFIRKVVSKLARSKVDHRVKGIVSDNKIDFVYPFDRPLSKKCKSAAWIYDFQHKYLPEFFSENEITSRDRWMLRVSRECKNIVFSSESARRDFQRFFPSSVATCHTLPFRVAVPSIDEKSICTLKAKYNLPNEYFIVCGQFWKHKNHLLVLQSIDLVKRSERKLTVVFTGRLGDYRDQAHIEKFMQRIHQLGINEECRVLGLIPKHEQLALLKGAVALVQPSLFEGWSTVIEESNALRVPVLASSLEVHREQSPPEVCYFDPQDARELAGLMTRSMLSRPQRAEDYGSKFLEFGRNFLQIAYESCGCT